MVQYLMFEKYRKLIIAQASAVMAVGAFILAALHHDVTGMWTDSRTVSFLAFGILLVGVEVKLILDWLKAKKATQAVEQ